MKLNFVDLSQQYQTAATEFLATKTYVLDDEITVSPRPKAGISIIKQGSKGQIQASSVTNFLRGLNMYLALAKEQADFKVDEDARFETVAAMLDVARNGVANVAYLKKMIARLASLGYTELWLYLEDEFEIPEYPYFGAQRGRYSQAQLHELALYADRLGLVLVPAIQTLAHLRNALKWQAFETIRDSDENLFVGKKETRDFLLAELKAASAPFLTKKIHLGMDEAYKLGRGRYMDEMGYRDQSKLILEHLDVVNELCEQLDLKPMMWSDMWFTIASPKHQMYDLDADFSIYDKLPNISQVYWDYYNEYQDHYEPLMKRHFELTDDVVFAAGIWSWIGMAPSQGKMLATLKAGTAAAKATGIKQIAATSWHDDGAETPFEAMWLGWQTFAEYNYYDNVDAKHLRKMFKLLQDKDYDSFMLLDRFDLLEGEVNHDGDNLSKIMLYEDLLNPRYYLNYQGYDLESYYQQLATKLKKAKVSAEDELLFRHYYLLAQTLSKKAKAVKLIQEVTKETVAQAQEALVAYRNSLLDFSANFRTIWHDKRHPQGYEVIDIRLGGQLARIQTAQVRLNNWLDGRDELSDVFAPKVLMDKFTSGPIGHGRYMEIASASDISW